MTPERWGEVKVVLEGALEKGPGDRAAFVAAACGEDSELRAEVESLLEFEAGSAGFIEEPLFGRFTGGLEGLAEGTPEAPVRARSSRRCAPRTITCLHGLVRAGWFA